MQLMCKQLFKSIGSCQLERESSILTSGFFDDVNVNKIDVFSQGNTDRRLSIYKDKEQYRADVDSFVQRNRGVSVLVFTDGSVYKGSVGCGACAAVLLPLSLEGQDCG